MNITSEPFVEDFLCNFKVKIKTWGFLFLSNRQKNTQTILDLEVSVVQVEVILSKLTVLDYSHGPEQDQVYVGSDMWIFGRIIKGQEIYIKITLGLKNKQVICISFHKAEYPMRYPFKI